MCPQRRRPPSSTGITTLITPWSKEQPEILAIIDWELATVGDCYMDVALMLMFWGDYRTQEPPAFSALQAVSRRAAWSVDESWPVAGQSRWAGRLTI